MPGLYLHTKAREKKSQVREQNKLSKASQRACLYGFSLWSTCVRYAFSVFDKVRLVIITHLNFFPSWWSTTTINASKWKERWHVDRFPVRASLKRKRTEKKQRCGINSCKSSTYSCSFSCLRRQMMIISFLLSISKTCILHRKENQAGHVFFCK